MSGKASKRPPRRRQTGGYRGYVYPLGSTATVGRIDQGQDFGGRGAILAIGNAKVVRLGAPGWPGGENGILYQLLDGPRKGRYVYVNEGVKPTVTAGQWVEAGQVIGRLIPGSSTGIEMGWANAAGVPLSHAEYHEGLETRAGKGFAAFLRSLGGLPKQGYADAFKNPAERHKIEEIGGEEGLKSGLSDVVPGGGIADEILSGILDALSGSAEALMLNIGLIGGGAFLIYYGVALMAGVEDPGLKLLRASKRVGETTAVAAAK